MQYSNYDNAQDSDLFLVERGGVSYQVSKANLQSKVQSTDWLLCERGGTSYKVSGADFTSSLMTYAEEVWKEKEC